MPDTLREMGSQCGDYSRAGNLAAGGTDGTSGLLETRHFQT
jgi:hypothetical protein